MKILISPEVQELLQPKAVPQANSELVQLWQEAEAKHKAEEKKKREVEAKHKAAQRVRYAYD
jgi:membrane protein involved in colicin uptake